MNRPEIDEGTASVHDRPMTNPHKGHVGFDRIVRAAGHSMAGLASAYRFESAFRQEAWAAAVLAPAALCLGTTWWQRLALIGVLLIVLVVELLNSAIEAAVDRISFDRHELSRRAKDQASAAVFLSLGFAVATWALVAAERFLG